MKSKIETGTLGLLLLFLIASAGGFCAGWMAKTTEKNTYVTEYVTQTQNQEQWQAQVNVTAVGGTNFRSVSVALDGRTNVVLKVVTNSYTNLEEKCRK